METFQPRPEKLHRDGDKSEIKSGPTPCVTNLISTGTNCIKSLKYKREEKAKIKAAHTLYKRSGDGKALIWGALILITATIDLPS